MMKRVVIWDPLGEVPCGEIVTPNEARLLMSRKVATLPVEDVKPKNGASGWAKRHFGRGEVMHTHTQGYACPLVLHIETTPPTIAWCARVQLNPRKEKMRGRLSLNAPPSQLGCIQLGLRSEEGAIVLEALQVDKWGGVTIEGRASFSSRLSGFLGLSLYGALEGGRVMWVAASQTQ